MECGPNGCPIVAFSDLTSAEQRVQRRRIAEKMYKQGFTQEQIAKQLSVSRETITKDLANLVINTKLKPAKTASNPKGAGRPKGSKLAARKTTPATDAEIAAKILDEGLSHKEAQEQFGVSDTVIRRAVANEEGRRDAVPEITPDMLSMSAQQKLAAAIRQHKHKLDMEFKARFNDEVSQKMRELMDNWLPQHQETQEKYERVLNSYRGIMPRAQFRLVLACLSPDSRRSVTDERLAEAFNIIKKLEALLVEKAPDEQPVSSFKFPRTYEEAIQMRREATAERRAKKSNRSNAVRLA